MRKLGQNDLVGLGWRVELGPYILSHLDTIDIVEVIVDDYFNCSKSKLRSLKTLESQVPVVYHGVGLGLASSLAVNQMRLEKLARVIDYLAPPIWSEHLAFVRANDIEIGHLAAPPRNMATIEGALENVERIKRTVGSLPALENIATLINPPGSIMPEPLWVNHILQPSGCSLLLDLNNLYSNAINFGFNPIDYLHTFALHQVRMVHLSGGKWIKEPPGFESNAMGKRMLDDHLHDVPDPVFDLLAILAQSVDQPLIVIIERDGNYPTFQSLLAEVIRAKKILVEARNKKCHKLESVA